MRRRRAVPAALVALVATACTGLPTTGPVVREPDVGTTVTDTSSYFTPPGPRDGDSRSGIVRGFLLAMQATPVSVAVARDFLTEEASDAWQPERRTLVYDGIPIAEQGRSISLALDGAIALDARGRWLGPQEVRPQQLRLVRERGQWRLANPPDALLVPSSYFADRFTRASIGFFDPSGRTIVPEPVHFPIGPQGATALVDGLLAGPIVPRATRSYAPKGTSVELSVSITATGAVEVPVSPQVLNLSRAELRQLAVQLSYTLAQVPGVSRIRLTTDGAPVSLGELGDAIPIGLTGNRAPTYAAAAGELFGVADGRVARVVGGQVRPAGEPWDSTPSSVSEVAVSLDGTLAAGVSTDGRRLLLAPLLADTADDDVSGGAGGAGGDGGAGDAAGSTAAAEGAALEPVVAGRSIGELSWTRFGELWSLAEARRGAEVHVTVDGETSDVELPGISGRRISAMLVSRDGSRVVAAVRERGDTGERLVVARIGRDGTGALSTVLEAQPLPLLRGLLADGTTRVLDLAWTSATELALLTRPVDGETTVVRAAVDGSPVAVDSSTVALPPAGAARLVASPDPESGLRLLTTRGVVYQLATSGVWVRQPLPLLDDLGWVG